jgi:hypothetical protein
MPASYLREIVLKKAKAKEVEVLESMEKIVWDADKKLDREEIDIEKAIEMVKSAFGNKLDKWTYNDIEKEVRYKLK